MVRVIAFLAGCVFVLALVVAVFMPREAAEETVSHKFHLEAKEIHFAQDGAFGRYNREQLQRGFQVYKEVCAACHSLRHVAFRHLTDLGYNEPEIKAIANQWAIEAPAINPDTGEASTRKALPSDFFPSPYANETAARAANNNALPPDLSLITKAREHGTRYVYSLLTGYRDPATYKNEEGETLPADSRPSQGLHFNPYFANLNIAMPPPLVADGQVTYADGTRASVDQMSQDVAAFLTWTAEPKLENRKRTGLAVLIFLLIGTTLAYLAYQNIWRDKKAKRVKP